MKINLKDKEHRPIMRSIAKAYPKELRRIRKEERRARRAARRISRQWTEY
ncbi:MAG: hypothetical protein J6S14_13210 [Clostridia bacterium]|nr:hypothetical protein [Clostridia bacterium]